MEKFKIDGLDPLSLIAEKHEDGSEEFKFILEEASKGTVSNILKCYTGFFDSLSEQIQNALDAVEKKQTHDNDFIPKIWITIDIRNKYARIVDNGIGMTEQEFCYCFTPNVSFKRGQNLRGNKGVGATFLAYGFNYCYLASLKNSTKVAAVLRSGRQWVEDSTNKLARPKYQIEKFDVPELKNQTSGTCIEIRLSGQLGEKPKDLGWHGATKAEHWFDILRIVTPLGGIYLTGTEQKPNINITVIDKSGTETVHHSNNAEFYYPHEIPNTKTEDLKSINDAIKSIHGDPNEIRNKLPVKYRNLDCIYDIWDTKDLLDESNKLKLNLSEEEESLIRIHKISAYGSHLHSVKTFDKFNESIGLRNTQIMKGGLLLASDFMPQGELLIIPLKRFTGYQRNTFVIIHLIQGNPDLGRKVFQPEIKALAENISEQITKLFIKYRWLMKSDTGSTPTLAPNKDLHNWKKEQENWRDSNPYEFLENISYLSVLREEQDVVSLYNQLIGNGTVRGIYFFATTHSDRYDALIEYKYSDNSFKFHKQKNKLGVRNDIDIPYDSEPKVLEYKFDFDSILSDFEKEIKFKNHIDIVVCWKASGKYNESLFLRSLLVEDEGNSREFYGATHQAFMPGTDTPIFEVCILEELLNFLLNEEKEVANQIVKYGDK